MNYNSALKTWGATGTEYPDAYSYKKDESPVDEWDNFTQYNIIEDIKHLIGVTNDDLVLRENGSLLSDLTVGEFGLLGDAGSVDFGGTEITVDGTVDLLQSLDVGGSITVTGTVDGVDVAAFKNEFDSKDYDSLYINIGDPVPHAVYATTGDVPALSEGETVVVDGDLYVENGN